MTTNVAASMAASMPSSMKEPRVLHCSWVPNRSSPRVPTAWPVSPRLLPSPAVMRAQKSGQAQRYVAADPRGSQGCRGDCAASPKGNAPGVVGSFRASHSVACAAHRAGASLARRSTQTPGRGRHTVSRHRFTMGPQTQSVRIHHVGNYVPI